MHWVVADQGAVVDVRVVQRVLCPKSWDECDLGVPRATLCCVDPSVPDASPLVVVLPGVARAEPVPLAPVPPPLSPPQARYLRVWLGPLGLHSWAPGTRSPHTCHVFEPPFYAFVLEGRHRLIVPSSIVRFRAEGGLPAGTRHASRGIR